MNKTFDFEYDGVSYVIEAEYTLTNEDFDHEFGVYRSLGVECSSWRAWVNNTEIKPETLDEMTAHAIDRECDRVGLNNAASWIADRGDIEPESVYER